MSISMPAWRRFFRHGFHKRLDAYVLVLLWAVELLILWVRMSDYGAVDIPVLVLLSTLLYGPLFWRRRWPLLVFYWLLVSSTAMSVLVPGLHPLFCIWVGLFAVAAHSSHSHALVGLLLAGVPTGFNVAETFRDTRDLAFRPAILLAVTLFLTSANAAVYAVGRWVQWSVLQRHLVARLSAAQAEDEERRRIARELHDIVAHSVSLMALQAAGAERVLDSDPQRARQALRHVSALGEQTTTELRRMLGLLTTSAGSHADAPAALKRLQDIGDPINQLRAAGREVVLSLRGRPRYLDPETDEAAYRIVQEALTNAVKHADPAQPVQVDVVWGLSDVKVSVLTHGRAGAASELSRLSTGHGVRGMQERARAVGGTVAAGPTHDGGYRVFLTLPLSAGPHE
jgi:signal transduction histidine kinase